MKLMELYSKPLKEILEGLELSNMQVYTDDSGNAKAIELKYTEKMKAESENGKSGKVF